jgi:hypothetical protein
VTDEEDLTLEEYLSEDEDDWAEDDETSEDSVSERVRKTSLPSSPQATRNSTTRTEAIFLKDIIPHENQLKVIACREMNWEIKIET